MNKLMCKYLTNTTAYNYNIKSENEIDEEYPPYTVSIEKAKEMILGQVVFYCNS